MKEYSKSSNQIKTGLYAAVVVFLFYNGSISGTLGIVLLVFAGIFVLTSFISFCPLYAILGISTCSIKNKKS